MNHMKISIKLLLLMTLLTGIIYPLFIMGVARVFFYDKAKGSLIRKDNKIIGSLLIAQKTTEDKYFHPRPSAIDYNPLAPSGGSNLGPTAQKLKTQIEKIRAEIGNNAPSELLFSSGSGLDPHISLNTAYFQVPRVAKARSLSEEALKTKIQSLVERPQLGVFGSPYINVLKLNKALDDG